MTTSERACHARDCAERVFYCVILPRTATGVRRRTRVACHRHGLLLFFATDGARLVYAVDGADLAEDEG